MSDFDQSFFTERQRTNWEPLLERLRAFEQNVARSYRRFDKDIKELQQEVNSLGQRTRSLSRGPSSLAQPAQTKKAEDIGDASKIPQKPEDKTDKNKSSEASESSDLNSENGKDDPKEEENQDNENVEVFVLDPFSPSLGSLPMYDGNPAVSFSKWLERFQDTLNLSASNLDDAQKLNRLRYCLSGRARAELNNAQPAPTTLDRAITILREKFENANTKTIARQALSICHQAPGERVFTFANRLSEAVRAALTGEDEQTIQKRLLEEFLDRLTPDVQFNVKSAIPDSYSRAYELAEHFKLLLAGRNRMIAPGQISVAELAEKVNTLTVERRSNPKLCYYCKRTGHFIRECRQRKQDNFRENNRRHNRASSGDNWRDRKRHSNQNRFRDSSRNRSRSQSRDRSQPAPRTNVQFREPKRPGTPIRLATVLPTVLALTVITQLSHALDLNFNPMVCLPDAPSSLWRLPKDPVCPSAKWAPADNPENVVWDILRPNTVQYKTPASACRCMTTVTHRRRGLLGAEYTISEIIYEQVPISTCHRMRDLSLSPAGQLHNTENGTILATNNTAKPDWRIWPFNLFWKSEVTQNCFLYKSIVFTRFGTDHIQTPVGTCPECQYRVGGCRCEGDTLLWVPDITQQCRYVHVKTWRGSYANKIWLSDTHEFALSFLNLTKLDNCGKPVVISEQGFAVPENQYQTTENLVARRRSRRANNDVGPVYSSQLAAEMTALSAHLQQTTQQLFSAAVRHVCASLQSVADATLTLAVANPTLLARYLLNNSFLSARLITANMVEVFPCIAVSPKEVHIETHGRCFDKVPVTFMLYGTPHHGFLDTLTQIIHPAATEIACNSHPASYIPAGVNKLRQVHQLTGDIRLVNEPESFRLMRFGGIDFPDQQVGYTIFRNKVLANLSELYSPENFQETLEAAAISQEIMKLAKPYAVWDDGPGSRAEDFASRVVSTGLFSFLKGGMVSLVQLWTFGCCVYVTLTALTHFILPPQIGRILRLFNVFLPIIWLLRKTAETKENKKRRARQPADEQIPEAISLSIGDCEKIKAHVPSINRLSSKGKVLPKSSKETGEGNLKPDSKSTKTKASGHGSKKEDSPKSHEEKKSVQEEKKVQPQKAPKTSPQ